MFELTSEKKPIKTKVTFQYPVDNGETKKTFFAFFLMISIDEYNELVKKEDDFIFFEKVMTGWADIKDENGDDVEFSKGTLRLLLSEKRVKQALVNTYWDFFHGKDDRARKN